MRSLSTKFTVAAAIAAVFGLALAVASVAQADSYLSVYGGYTDLNDFDLAAGGKTSVRTDNGLLAGVAYGVRLPDAPDWRLETEFSYRNNDIARLQSRGTNLTGAGGDVDVSAAMINLYYNFQPALTASPYLGAGIGGAQVAANNIRSATGVIADGSDTVLAWQGMVGFSYRVAPGAAMFIEARYFATENPNIGRDAEFSYDSTDIMLGLKFLFR